MNVSVGGVCSWILLLGWCLLVRFMAGHHFQSTDALSFSSHFGWEEYKTINFRSFELAFSVYALNKYEECGVFQKRS